MARAPRTGFYFEPLSERLVLVVEGFAFPSDDAWAYVGDPVEMTQELARLHVAARWPGIDPDALAVEFDINLEKAVQQMERLQREEREKEPGSGEIDFDVQELLRQAENIRELARNMRLPDASDLEEEIEKRTLGDEIAEAHGATSRAKKE
jgi:hypothetical protein